MTSHLVSVLSTEYGAYTGGHVPMVGGLMIVRAGYPSCDKQTLVIDGLVEVRATTETTCSRLSHPVGDGSGEIQEGLTNGQVAGSEQADLEVIPPPTGKQNCHGG